MARKNNIRSMRFSDDVIEMIESQAGRNFSEKFENLVTRCMWELPEKERQIEELDKELKQKQQELTNLSYVLRNEINQAHSLSSSLISRLEAISRFV